MGELNWGVTPSFLKDEREQAGEGVEERGGEESELRYRPLLKTLWSRMLVV